MFSHQYWSAQYFPPVWFAPGDESGVPQDELRLEYHGGKGGMRPARDPFADATDADLERMVRDKWEAIERSGVKEPLPTDQQGLQVAPEVAPPEESHDRAGTGRLPEPLAMPPPNSIIGRHYGPISAADPLAAALIARQAEAARRQKEEEALILLLLEV